MIFRIERLFNKQHGPQTKFVFILGMHRSGTSCLAGSLEKCGLYLGDVSRFNRYNVKGNHELRKVTRINDKILAASGGTWQEPPAQIVVSWWQRLFQKKVVAQLSRCSPCGIKDPRLLLMLESWIKIPKCYKIIGSFRNPEAVAQSLARRNRQRFPLQVGYNLWLRYNNKLVHWHKRFNFPIIEFDLSDIAIYCETVAAVATTLGLKPDIAKINEFVSAELENISTQKAAVPVSCQETYSYLKEHRFIIGNG